jgi:ribosome biogenesis GTPase
LPVAGDWVAVRAFPGDGLAIIHAVLPRMSLLARRAAGSESQKQPLAANVDAAWILTSVNGDLNVSRIERYVALVTACGVTPLAILSKADLLKTEAEREAALASLGARLSAVLISSKTGEGIPRLEAELSPGKTVVLLGSSGAGKSTLINSLAGGAIRRTAEIREEDAKGRHTTTSRDLIVLPSGGLIIDSPGLREAGLAGGAGDDGGFSDIADLADSCQFRDCRHEAEPGCAVRSAVHAGSLDNRRLENFLKLRREAEYFELRESTSASFAEKTRWKSIHKMVKKMK